MRRFVVGALASALSLACAIAPCQGQPARASDSTRSRGSADDSVSFAIKQTLTFSGIAKTFRVGATSISESVAPFSYHLTSPRFGVQLTGTPVRLNAQPIVVNAWVPLQINADYILRAGDTLSVYGRTGSSPVTLDSLQTIAVGAVSTSVVDLSSQWLGMPAQVGARAVLSFPVADVVLAVSGALEQDAKPPATGAAYWLGTTVRGGLTVNANLGDRKLTIGTEVTHSSADSLSGRNQFPGGGDFTLSADLAGPLDASSTISFIADGYYSRPFGNARSDQPTRLIPSGDLLSLSGTLLVGTGALLWSPSVTVLRESSSAVINVQQGVQRLSASLNANAWSAAAGLTVDIPFGRSLTLTPEFGAIIGAVNESVSRAGNRVIVRRGRAALGSSATGSHDAVRGVWGGIGLSAKF